MSLYHYVYKNLDEENSDPLVFNRQPKDEPGRPAPDLHVYVEFCEMAAELVMSGKLKSANPHSS